MGKNWNEVIQSDEFKKLSAAPAQSEPEDTVATPYGDVRGPKSAIDYVRELIADDVALGSAVRND